MFAKFHKFSFVSRSNSVNLSFELLHLDIWGPFDLSSIFSDNFFVTMVDDKARCSWTYLMKYKRQMVQLVSNFISYIKNQFNAKGDKNQ